MFLLVLDKDPIKSAKLVPDKIKFKQLIELGQLICSAGISDVYKPIKQGKELQEWVRKNKGWCYFYFTSLLNYSAIYAKLKAETYFKLATIRYDLRSSTILNPNDFYVETAIFRYSKDYECMTKYKTNTELPIRECVKEYKKYVEWKKIKGVRGYA